MFKSVRNAAMGMFVVAASGCATNLHPGGPTPSGLIFSNARSTAPALAIEVSSDVKMAKSGSAMSSAVLGLFAFGDSSVTQAMKSAGITKVHHVDYVNNTVLAGLFISTTTIVYGE